MPRDYDTPESGLTDRVDAEIGRLETRGEKPRHLSYMVIPRTGIYRKIGNRTFYRLYGLHYYQDIQSALDAAHSKVFIKDSIYTIVSPILQNKDSLSLEGESMPNTITNRGTQLSITGNIDGIDISGRSCHLERLQLITTSAAQTAGKAISVTGFGARINHVNIGSVQNRQHFFQGVVFDSGSQYSLFADSVVNNCVSKAIWVTGVANNRMLERVSVVNWGANIFATNPVGLFLDTSFGGDFFSDVSIATCGTGVQLSSGAGQALFEEHFVGFDVVNNWGQGLVISCSSTGRIDDIEFIKFYCATNCQAAASTLPGINISATAGTLSSLHFIGGECSNHPNEGFTIGPVTGSTDTFTGEIELVGMTVHDNNINGTSKTYDGFGSIKQAGLLVNATTAIVKMVGGELDNPGTGTAGGTPGNQSGIIVSRATDVRLVFVELSRNITSPFGDAAGGKTRLVYCHGYTPFARLAITVTASPFIYQNTDPTAQNVTVVGGTVSQIAVSRDGATYDNINMSTGVQVHLAKGDYVKVTYSVAPTMFKYGLEA